MPTQAERTAVLGQVATLAITDVVRVWRAVSSEPVDFATYMVDAVPEALDPYAATAADLAAGWYDEDRPGRIAVPAALAPTEQLQNSVRWALRAYGAAGLARLAGFGQRTVYNAARDTIADNAAADGERWFRYSSATACEFCRMVATRGSVYHSADSAGGDRRFHDNCRCMPALESRTPLPSYYEDWEREYREAARIARGSSETDVLAAMRELAHA